jgi:hypothetical protein
MSDSLAHQAILRHIKIVSDVINHRYVKAITVINKELLIIIIDNVL